MNYELTIKIQLESAHNEERVIKQFESLFEFGTIKESIAVALQLGNDPRLTAIAVQPNRGGDKELSSSF